MMTSAHGKSKVSTEPMSSRKWVLHMLCFMLQNRAPLALFWPRIHFHCLHGMSSAPEVLADINCHIQDRRKVSCVDR